MPVLSLTGSLALLPPLFSRALILISLIRSFIHLPQKSPSAYKPYLIASFLEKNQNKVVVRLGCIFRLQNSCAYGLKQRGKLEEPLKFLSLLSQLAARALISE